jgi:hypothetical protein
MRFNLTLAGGGGRSSGGSAFGGLGAVSSAFRNARGAGQSPTRGAGNLPTRGARPKPPPAPPTGNIRDQAMNIGNQAAKRTGAENIRNTGGGRGTQIGQAVRALKGLTGQ